jgi:hypothetical protein
VTDSSNKSLDLAALDTLTGGAFTVSTSADRTARLRDWLAGHPTLEQVQAAFDEMSHRDKGAAKVLREKLDELRRSKDQDALVVEWAAKGEALRDAPHINLTDAMGWQRDAAKAGAPLSREPLAGLKTALAERVKAIEDLQHQTQVQREAAVLLAQRIEVLSTKPWQDALAQRDSLQTDLDRWVAQAQALAADAQWPSVDAKFAPALQTSTQQVQAVWTAFGEALTLTEAAAADAAAPLPAVPAWSDQIRVARGEVLPQAAAPVKAAKPAAAGVDATRKVKPTADKAVVDQKRLELAIQAEALFKPAPAAKPAKAKVPKADEPAPAQDAAVVEQTAVESTQGAAVDAPAVIEVTAAETASAEVVTPVADDVPEAVAEVALDVSASEAAPAQKTATAKADDVVRVPAVGGRKMQETLRNLREQWKKIDKEAAPNPALWKRFDSACNRAHEVVDAWLKEARAQTTAHKAQRLALIEEVKAWTVEHANGPDWKGVARQLHQFAQRWRESGHLSEKMFAELQPVWKAAIHAAHEPLEVMQKASLARRHALIAEAQALGAAPTLRVDAVKALQQRWQEEAHAVVLDRKQEQKLWDAFRQPIDEAFARKSSVREQSQAALTPHDKAVLDAAKALDSATAKGDASAIRAAMQMLEQIARGEVVAPVAAPANAAAAPAAAAEASSGADAASDAAEAATEVTTDASAEAASNDAAHSSDDVGTQENAEQPADHAADAAEPVAEVAPVKPKAAPRPVVAVRGDDRPGQKRTEAAPAGRGRDGKPGGKFGDKPGFGRDGKPGRDGGRDGGREGFVPRGPRLGDAAFRAQRFALESAQDALRRLAAQAHGEVLTQLMHAWERRDAAQLPAAQAIGNKLSPAQRTQWSQALTAQPQGEAVTPLLRLEVAADLPTPAAHMDARRALQLQMLTRRNDPSPQMTWAADAAQVLGGAYDEAAARRLQAALKVLLKR